MAHKIIDADRFIVRDAGSLSVPGQNEKDIWVDPKNGYEYIAKKPGRNGRVETLTEYLLNLLGMKLGLRVAVPQLGRRQGELRFMSKKFHSQDELLQHGHEFLGQFYSSAEMSSANKHSPAERVLYSVAHVLSGFEAAYMVDADRFKKPFVKMLFFDAAVGCQDRHPKNWGILRSVMGARLDHFAPLFDTARGLFWEFSTPRIKTFTDAEMARYVRRSSPPIGDFGGSRVTHFALVEQILSRHPEFSPMLRQMVSCDRERATMDLIDSPVGDHFAKSRKREFKRCLEMRFVTLRQIAASKGTGPKAHV
jgi:HipA-like C-terminal domain